MTDVFTHDDLELLGSLATATLDPVAPPPELRAQIVNAVRALPSDRVTIRAEEGRWFAAGPGVSVKRLSATASTVTVLMQLAPDAIIPAHDHHGPEDSFIISGSCHFGPMPMSAGDFHHAESTAHHGQIVASAEGCLLLVTMDRADFEAA
jgi:anti-sigma factor ChrR (cupin superfamily)